MNLVFSVDQNWAIGNGNKLLFRAKGDMANLKKLTTGNIIIMGYNTLQSLPNGRPLPNRENIILSRKNDLQVEGAIVCHGLEELFQEVERYDDDRLFVFGGEQVYRLLMPYCKRAYVTKFQAVAKEADCFLPDLDQEAGWRLTEETTPLEENGLIYSFAIYEQAEPVTWRNMRN